MYQQEVIGTEAPPTNDPLEGLYKGLLGDGTYTKSFDEFKTKYSTRDNIDKLYSGLFEDGDYTKSKDDFYKKYFSKALGYSTSAKDPSPFGFEAGIIDFKDPYASLKQSAGNIQVGDQKVDMSNTFGPLTAENIEKKSIELAERVKAGKLTKSELNSISSITGLPVKAVSSIIGNPEDFKYYVNEARKGKRIEHFKMLDAVAYDGLRDYTIDREQLIGNPAYAEALLINFKDIHDQEIKRINSEHPFMRINTNAPVNIPRENSQEHSKKIDRENRIHTRMLDNLGTLAANQYARMNPTSDPLEIGLEYEKLANPERYKLRLKAGGSPHDRDIYQRGIEALLATGNPNAIALAEKDEFLADDIYPDKKNAEVYHKLGAVLYKDGKNNKIFNKNPSSKELEKAAEKLSPEDKAHFLKHILPVEERNIGSNVPVSGALNKFAEGVITSTQEIGNSIRDIPILPAGIERTESDQAKDLLSQAHNTRYQNVGESPEALATIKYLKEKPTLTEAEQNHLEELESYTNIRSTASEIFDGMGNVGGQVFIQAIGTKGLGAAFTRLAAGAGMVKTARAIKGLSTEEMIANAATDIGISKSTITSFAGAITAFAASYDGAKRMALELFPDDKDADKRLLYSNIVAAANAGSERIFKDEKILDAFSRNLAPGVSRLVDNISVGSLSKSSLVPRLKTVFTNGYRMVGEGFVETNKEAVEEAVASGAESVAKLILAPSKFSEKEAFDDVLSSYTSMLLHGGPVGLLAGIRNVRASHAGMNLISKIGVDQSLTNDVKEEINREFLNGELSQAAYDSKMKLLNDAITINTVNMPEVKSSGLTEKAGQKYMAAMLHEKNLENEISQTHDIVVQKVLQEEIKSSQDLRFQLLKGEKTVDENYVPIDNTPEAIEAANPKTEIPTEPEHFKLAEEVQEMAPLVIEENIEPAVDAVRLTIEKGLSEKAPEVEKKDYRQKVKPVTTALRNMAKQIREFEMRDSSGEKITGAMMDISAIPRKVLAEGLETMAFAIESGASLAQSISDAVEMIRYQHPDAKEAEVRDFLVNQMEGAFETGSPARVTKRGIMANVQTGKITGEKIELTPRQALHKQIKDQARGARIGYRSGKADQKSATDAMTTRVKGLLTDARNKGFITSKQWETLFNRANKIGTNQKRFDRFSDFVEKVLLDADYEAKLNTAISFRNKIKSGISTNKDRSAYTRQTVKEFGKIDPAKVEDIDIYNAIASRITGVAEGVKVSTKDGRPVTKNESFNIDSNTIEAYIQSHERYASQEAKNKFAEDYADLVAAGVIDPVSMSLKEMKDLVDAINGTSEDAAQKAVEAFEAKQQRLEALRNVVEYNRMALETDPANSKKENEIVENIKQLDIANMDAGTLAVLNDIINNIVNNDFTGSEKLSIIADAQRSIKASEKAIANFGITNLGSIRSTLLQGFSSMAQLHDFIFKSTRLASQIQMHSGVAAIFEGHARAQSLQNTTLDAEKKLKSKKAQQPVNVYRRGVLAYVMNHFGGTPEEMQAEFNRTKALIRQTGERLMKSDVDAEKREGELVLQVYDELLKTSDNADQVLRRSSPENIEIINFWRGQFDKRKAQTQENAELFNNMVWEDVENYTATKMKNLGGQAGMTQEEVKEVFTNNYIGDKVTQQVAGSKLQKTRSTVLPTDKVLNLDFDRVQSQVFYRTNYDVETSAAIEKVKAFFSDPRSSEIFGGVGNKKIVMNSVREAVNAQRGQLHPSTPADKVVNSLTNMLRAKGVRIALGSISQTIKQYPSVAINSMINLGGDAYLFGKALMVSNKIKLFDQLPIGLRGEAKAGYNKDVKIREAMATKFTDQLSSVTSVINEKAEKLSDVIMAALVKSDVSVARTSWLAYYMQELKRQGIRLDSINWETEHENINRQAAAYAEQQVSRTQNPNDVSSGAAFYRDSKGTSGFFKNLVLPFSTFVVNARVRMSNDVQKIMYGGDKAEAFKSLAGTAAEMVTFNAVKTYIIATLTTMGAREIARMFEMWDEEDEATAKNREQLTIDTHAGQVNVSAKTKRVIANSTSDFFFSGLGSLTQAAANEGMNALYKLGTTETFVDGQANKYPSLFYSRSSTEKSPDYAPYGLYGTLAAKIASMKNSGRYAITGQYPGVDRSYEDAEVTLTPEERKLYTLSFVIDAIGVVGLSDADILMMNQRLKWIADKELADKYGVQDKLMERNVRPK